MIKVEQLIDLHTDTIEVSIWNGFRCIWSGWTDEWDGDYADEGVKSFTILFQSEVLTINI